MKKIILILLAIGLMVGGYVAWKIFGPAVSITEQTYFYIKSGDNLGTVKENLVYQQIIPDGSWFDRVAKALKFKKVKPGRYKLQNRMSLFKLVRLLRSGNHTPVNFVITKLRTKENLAAKAGSVFEFDSLQMISFLNNPDSLKAFGLDTNTVMVTAMPFTYSMNWSTTPSRLFRELNNAYRTFWNKERKQKADSLGISPEQVSILASIIDEETRAPSDRPHIASVYLNRIRQGMPLQADPTVKFAMKDFGLKRILNVHLQTASPYNTYINKGLPPGPICTPAVETIDAVLDSPKTDYLYFVANSNFDGTHIFTTKYADHMKYAREYQQALNKLMDSLKKVNPK